MPKIWISGRTLLGPRGGRMDHSIRITSLASAVRVQRSDEVAVKALKISVDSPLLPGAM
jgi:hypothetical protein